MQRKTIVVDGVKYEVKQLGIQLAPEHLKELKDVLGPAEGDVCLARAMFMSPDKATHFPLLVLRDVEKRVLYLMEGK